MSRYDDPESLNSRLWDAAHGVYASKEAEQRAAILERLADHPELHRGLKGLPPHTLFMASILDKDTLVRTMTKGLKYEDERLERIAAHRKTEAENEAAEKKHREDLEALRASFQKLMDEDAGEDECNGMCEELALQEARAEEKYRKERKARFLSMRRLDRFYEMYSSPSSDEE